jgi:hypothetical protein
VDAVTWYLQRPSEFDLQASLYHELRSAGYEVRGEVKFKRPGERGLRADLLILHQGRPALIIEVKPYLDISRCRKDARYTAATGLPCIVIGPENRTHLLALVQYRLQTTSSLGT